MFLVKTETPKRGESFGLFTYYLKYIGDFFPTTVTMKNLHLNLEPSLSHPLDRRMNLFDHPKKIFLKNALSFAKDHVITKKGDQCAYIWTEL